jgi:hypothetical protein
MLSGLIRQGIVQYGLKPLVRIGLKYGKEKKRHPEGCSLFNLMLPVPYPQQLRSTDKLHLLSLLLSL